MLLNMESLTPNKTQIVTTVKGKNIGQRIKYINKKGTFKFREQCKKCKYLGKVQDGLVFHIGRSCDREDGSWKQQSGVTDRKCKYFVNED